MKQEVSSTTKKTEELSEFAKKCVNDENSRDSKIGAYAAIRHKIEELPQNVPVTQPRLVAELGIANPTVNNTLRKMLDSKWLYADKTSKPFRYYRNQ